MADRPAPQVIAWLDGVDSEALWLTAITVFEIKGGIDAKPKGRRKQALIAAFDQLLLGDFRNRALSFDLSAALHAARIDVDSQKRAPPPGLPIRRSPVSLRATGPLSPPATSVISTISRSP
jgi:predicted nucleic acid-binding protein